jgi:hypothetical protein
MIKALYILILVSAPIYFVAFHILNSDDIALFASAMRCAISASSHNWLPSFFTLRVFDETAEMVICSVLEVLIWRFHNAR